MNILSAYENDFKSKSIADEEALRYYKSNLKMFMTGDYAVVMNCLIKADERVLDSKKMNEKYNEAVQVLELLRNKKFDDAKILR